MASVVKIKRSSVQGKAPTTSDLQTGELALNTRDGKLFSSDGSSVFEIGANVHSLNVGTGGISVGNSAFTLPTTDGTDGQVLKTDGSGNVTWQNDAAGSLVSANTNTNTATVIDQWPAATYRSGKYDAQVSTTDGHMISSILVLHSNNTVHFTQFGDITIASKASIGNFNAQFDSVSGANVQLTFTPTGTNYISNVDLRKSLFAVNDALSPFAGDIDLETQSLGTFDLENENVGDADLGTV